MVKRCQEFLTFLEILDEGISKHGRDTDFEDMVDLLREPLIVKTIKNLIEFLPVSVHFSSDFSRQDNLSAGLG